MRQHVGTSNSDNSSNGASPPSACSCTMLKLLDQQVPCPASTRDVLLKASYMLTCQPPTGTGFGSLAHPADQSSRVANRYTHSHNQRWGD
jgi:hypothetical protein